MLWNELSMLIRNSPSLSNFKCRLKGIMYPKPNPLYSFGLGRAPVHLARLGMGLSGLNQHRHHGYHYILRPLCDSCGHIIEDNIHFLLHCPTYQRVRNTLILSVSPIIVDIYPVILNIRNNRHAQALVNISLTGDPRLSTETNKVIFHMFLNTLLQPNDSDDDEFSFTQCISSTSDECMIYFRAHVNVNITVWGEHLLLFKACVILGK